MYICYFNLYVLCAVILFAFNQCSFKLCYSNYIFYALAKVLKKVCAPPKVCFKFCITPLIICMKKVFAPSIFAPAHPSDKYFTVPKNSKELLNFPQNTDDVNLTEKSS